VDTVPVGKEIKRMNLFATTETTKTLQSDGAHGSATA
jgi:hypothetical protein